MSKILYAYLAGKQVAEVTNGNVVFAHADALGSPVARTGPEQGAPLLTRTRFEPYGLAAAGTEPSKATSSIGFTGHVQDSETDLVYMQQRFYDPVASRFLSIDPIPGKGDGGGFNRYACVLNNPYGSTDPDGRECTGSRIKGALCDDLGVNVTIYGGGRGRGDTT